MGLIFPSLWWLSILLSILLLLGGCQRAYLGTMEWLGYPKREVLVERIEAARNAQRKARDEFYGVLVRYRDVVRPGDGAQGLRARYRLLDDQYQLSQASAGAVHRRINAVEAVARSLFRDWESQLAETADQQLQEDGRRQLQATRRRYQRLIYTMHRAESRLDPVLRSFNDQILFIKHNLNGQAVAALEDELIVIEGQVRGLTEEMERSIAAAEAFIQEQEASLELARERPLVGR
ncbi:MAG: DUF2959 family protein [Candidatus Competibacteraceae bacterium]|nr:DUF2959 family protein [Candidatus Competibacteraceae bacterium]